MNLTTRSTTVSTLTAQSTRATTSRKNLADATKSFKKLTTAQERLDSVKPLLKLYQEEIDALSKSRKFAEQSYNELWLESVSQTSSLASQLKDAVATSASVTFSASSSSKIAKLEADLADYEAEFKTLKNQDLTIKQLQKQIHHLENNNAAGVDEHIANLRVEMEEEAQVRIEEALAREAEALRKLEKLALELKLANSNKTKSETHNLADFEASGIVEAKWEAEKRILCEDAERLNEELLKLQREKETLNLELTKKSSSSTPVKTSSDSTNSNNNNKNNLLAYEAENTELTMVLARVKQELHQTAEDHQQQLNSHAILCETLQKGKEDLEAQIDNLQSTIAGNPTKEKFQRVSRELSLLKKLQFHSNDGDGDGDDDDSSSYSPELTNNEADNEPDLESVLMSRVRRLEADLLKEKRVGVDRGEEISMSKVLINNLTNDKVRLEALVEKLEGDLIRLVDNTKISSSKFVSPVKMGEGEGQAILRNILSPKQDDATSSMSSMMSPMPPFEEKTQSPAATAATAATTAATTAEEENSMSHIIISQRDRMSRRCDEMEAERDGFKNELTSQVRSAEKYKSENAKLYEKVRYLQSLAKTHNNYNAGVISADVDLEALERTYETKSDPFREFGRRERARRIEKMSQIEKFVYGMASFSLGNKKARTTLFVYVISMHFLVFVTSYHWAHEKSCGGLGVGQVHEDFLDHPDVSHMMGGAPGVDSGLTRM